MSGYRKLLIVSSIGLAAIMMVLYSFPFIDWNPLQHLPPFEATELEPGIENQASSQIISSDYGNQEVPSKIEVQATTNKLQDISPTTRNVSLSGWVGTDFGEYLAGETVILYSPSQKARYSIVTGDSGEYKFVDIKPGWDYVLKVSPRGRFDTYSKSQFTVMFSG